MIKATADATFKTDQNLQFLEMEQHCHSPVISESSQEPRESVRTPNQSKHKTTNNESSPNASDNNYSDNYESETDYSLIRENSTCCLQNVQHKRTNCGTVKKKFRSSTPNKECDPKSYCTYNNYNNNINNNNCSLTNTNIKSHALNIEREPAQNESGFVDMSSQHLNSSPEPGSTERDDVKYICPICEVVSATPHEFTNHIRCHNYTSSDTENFKCRICFKVLSSASSLDRHVLVHTGERPFNCKYCHLTFTTNGNMHRHMRTHKQHIQQRNDNNVSDSVVETKSNAVAGSRSSGSGNGNCESDESDGCSTDSGGSNSNNRSDSIINNSNLCKRKNSEDDSCILKRRIKTINNNNIFNEVEFECNSSPQKIACPLCSRSDFLNMFTLGMHMDREHSGISAKCRKCEIVFKSHKSLNSHRCTQKSNIKQGFKDLTFVDFTSEKFPLIAKSLCEQSLRTPITNQKFECPKCTRAFPCASAVEIHAIDCGDIPHDYSIRKRTCSESSEEESRRDEFFAHLDLRNKSAMSLPSTMSSPQTSEKSETLAKPNVQQSIDEIKDLADIQSILNVTSTSNSFLKNFENVDTSLTSDYNHGKDEEEAQDAFTSEFRKMKLRGEFPCKLCTAVFPNLRALKGHNRVHLSTAGTGPYSCNMCPYAIHDKAALIRHMRTHNGDRPFECAVCNYAFTTKANCERHLRNRHGKTTREDVKRSIIYHPSEDSSCEDPIKKGQILELDDEESSSTLKDRSTPVSHLKEMLQSNSPIKIQVKSLEKLMNNNNTNNWLCEEKAENPSSVLRTAIPIDPSMDVLDLSKKAANTELKKLETKEVDFFESEKNQQWFLAQQQLFTDSISQIDPANYIQLTQLYRNLIFPAIPPFIFSNSFLSNNFGDLNKFSPMLLNPLYPPRTNINDDAGNLHVQSTESLNSPLNSIDNKLLNPAASIQHFSSSPQQINLRGHPSIKSQAPTSIIPHIQNTGPVKMVIKNGVLMPKQKQRRYRTERPFICEHCAARFTLRSNMERHVKQQHPQFWAQRQRNGQHIIRRNAAVAPQCKSTSVSPQGCSLSQKRLSAIPDQVKYAILAQQLTAHKDTDMLQHTLPQIKGIGHINVVNSATSNAIINIGLEDDDPKLVIDEGNEGNDEQDEGEEDENYDEPKVEDLSTSALDSIAKNVSEILSRENISSLQQNSNDCHSKEKYRRGLSCASSAMLEQAQSVRKHSKNENSCIKDDSDLVPVSKLVDNVTNSLSSFNSFFRAKHMPSHLEHSDEEGLVASGSTSESNQSGSDDQQGGCTGESKRRSAYSLAPNRVSCNYCQRTFPWTSSLRRHILTHTGQKPFKCSHCPLLFTTKSNCDRHLLRKHGNVESAVSLYVPTEDIADPILVPRFEGAAEELKMSQPSAATIVSLSASKPLESLISSSDLPFKCHLCDNSFADRTQCLDHIKVHHYQEFALLLSKGAIDADMDYNQLHSTEDDERVGEGRGKYPDYANRKVMCAFCMRRFWSTEDLRRHMRTHSGERPFQCDVCLRKFTLKHSMLRHMKKHTNGQNHHQSICMNSGSDMSEDEQPRSNIHKRIQFQEKIHDTLRHSDAWRNSNFNNEPQGSFTQQSLIRIKTEKGCGGVIGSMGMEENSDLISDLLGIKGEGILNKLLSSPDEAAKLLGVEK